MSDRVTIRNIKDVDFGDAKFLAAPWPDLLRLQNEDPIHWSDQQRGWIVTRHADVKAGFGDKRLASARGDQLFGNLPPQTREQLATAIKYNALNVNRLDGTNHLRIRTLMMKAFSRNNVMALVPMIEGIVDDILDEAEHEGEFDFLARVSAVLPSRVIQKMLGIPDEERWSLFKLASDFTAATGAARLTDDLLFTLDASFRSMNVIFNQLISDRESNPGEDLISVLVHARDGLNRLNHDELLACFHSIIVAGVETTAHTLGIGLATLAQNPAIAARAAQGADVAYGVVTELLRYPGTVKCMTRLAAEDFTWHGREIHKGDLVWLMIAGANTDPTVFDDALIINPERDNAVAMTFGPGLHHCVGHLLTRLELSTFFSRAFARFRITLLSEQFEMVPSYIFRGFKTLPVRFERLH